MEQMLSIQLDQPVVAASIINSAGAAAGTSQLDQSQLLQQLQTQEKELDSLCSQFKNVVDTLGKMQSELFDKHKEDVAHLAVEIARKVLAGKIDEGDYQIESIIKQALENAPVQEDIVVRLNPQDYSQIEDLLKTPLMDSAQGVTFVADAKISLAQCVLETPKGIIESFIDEHLDRITEALKKAG